MWLNSVSPERPLSLTESRSSISIWAPLTVFNIHLSEIGPFQSLMCSEMPPALEFSFKSFILCTSSLTTQCYDSNIKLLTYLNNKLFSHESKILNYDGLWENKNSRMKINASMG